MIKAGVFGATGFAGHELVGILARHPDVRLQFATSQSFAGQWLSNIYPQAPPLPLIDSGDAPLDQVDVVFLCLPHAAAAETAVAALAAGCTVIDLSADFRLRDADVYAEWYGKTHPAPELLPEAVYGLTEWARPLLPQARLVAVPGCYPTSILLALRPLFARGIPLQGPIIADAKSGVSGAGRSATATNHFMNVNDNFTGYKLGRAHRHLPEMEQLLTQWADAEVPQLIFSPHLLPVPRGILSTLYVTPTSPWSMSEIRGHYDEIYQGEPFVCLLPPGQSASLAHVNQSNRCVISLTEAGNTIVISSAIDNLLKGAAGQAVQNMNVVFQLEETAGLAGVRARQGDMAHATY